MRDGREYVLMLHNLLGLAFRGDMGQLLEHTALVREIFEFDKLQDTDFGWSISTLAGFLDLATHANWWMNEPLGSS